MNIEIGVISDSHGSSYAIDRAVKEVPDVKEWFHLGDFADDGAYLAARSGVSVTAVRGNNDFRNGNYQDLEIVERAGVRILLLHGHQYFRDGGLKALIDECKELQVQLCIFGHSHRQDLFKKNDIVFLNPGSIYLPRDGGEGSYAILTVGGGKIQNISLRRLVTEA